MAPDISSAPVNEKASSAASVAGDAASVIGVVAGAAGALSSASPPVAAIEGFFIALPKLISLFERIGNAVATERYQKWVNNLDQTITNLENANTDAEYFSSAAALARSIHGL